MEWNVFYYNLNNKKIETTNIFKHGCFTEYVNKHLKECNRKEEFADKLRSELRYYFWSKAEYEVVISPWYGGVHTDDIKIDIYDQVMNNWPIFLDYVWSNKNGGNLNG